MVNYGTIYTLPFKSRKEVSYLIEIQKENYTGDSVELVGSGGSPFSVSRTKISCIFLLDSQKR